MILTKKGPNQSTISIEETFRAPKDKVFKAWTTPESLKKWFMADEGVVVKEVTLALEVGGAYEIVAEYPGYDPTPIHGKFIHVIIPDMLEYTWLTPVLNGKMTKVDVAFIEDGLGSKIILNHGEFANQEEMKLHIQGWKACIARLHKFLE